MSLLHQEQQDDAARGEELTKGTSHVVWAAVIAAVVVTAAIAVYVIAGQKPPVATGEIEAVWVHPLHSETSGFDANGTPIPHETFDQVMVFAKVRLHNQSKFPLYLWNMTTNAAIGDEVRTSYVATAANYDRVFAAYPALGVPHGPALQLDTTIAPGQSLEGEFVSAFQMTKEQWDARKDLNFTFAFRYQPNLVLKPRIAIVER